MDNVRFILTEIDPPGKGSLHCSMNVVEEKIKLVVGMRAKNALFMSGYNRRY